MHYGQLENRELVALRRRSNSIPWCISFSLILSLRTWRNHVFHALLKPCFHTWDYVASAFKSTALVYIHCVSKGGFCRCSKGFNLCFVGLSRNKYKLRRKHGRTKKNCRLFVVNSPVVELLAGAGKTLSTDTNKFFFGWPKHLRK